MSAMTHSALDEIRNFGAGSVYPRELLSRCKTALVLFAAGFYGSQDAVWIAEAGIQATCIDIRPVLLAKMARFYPADWEFVCADAFDYVLTADRQWDLLSIDCPTSAFGRCAELAPVWCLLAKVAVVLGSGKDTKVEAPSGWIVTDVRRRSDFNGGVFWTVLEKV